MQTMRAETIGAMAAARATTVGFTAKVAAAVSNAVYLTDREGETFWVSPSGSSPHRRAILAVPTSPAWTVGMVCRYRNGLLCSEDGSAVDVREATIWRALSTPRPPVRLETAALALRAGLEIHSRAWAPTGWAAAGRSGARGKRGESNGQVLPLAAAFADEAKEPISELLAARDTRDTSRMLDAAMRLVGLGEGLTPSGDDFLGGYLFTLRHLDTAYPLLPSFDWEAVEAWLTGVASRTNAISFCLLSDLAYGHGPEPLHSAVDAALAGAQPHEIAQHASRVAGIGQTSGREMLVGVTMAMGLFPEVDDPERALLDGVCAGRIDRGTVEEAIPSRGAHGN